MPNRERISEKRFREWEQALAPYENDVKEFAREKGLSIQKWYHDSPNWVISRAYAIKDGDKIWRSIQLGYIEREKKLGMVA